MNAAEVLQLCRLVKACCPSQVFDEYTPQAWELILSGYDYADAKTAVAALVSAPLEPGRSRYIEPGHIIGGIKRIREKRVADNPMPEPPAGLTVAEYITWQRTTRDAIASGTYRPPTDPQPARPEVVALIRQAAGALAIDRAGSPEGDPE